MKVKLSESPRCFTSPPQPLQLTALRDQLLLDAPAAGREAQRLRRLLHVALGRGNGGQEHRVALPAERLHEDLS